MSREVLFHRGWGGGNRCQRLRRYFLDEPKASAVPVILVPPLMLTAEVWDVAPGASAVEKLSLDGADPWVVDFGSPEKEKGGLKRTLSDHVLAIAASVEAVVETTGRDVHLMGYSQGGMFAYQAAAYCQSDKISSLVTSPPSASVFAWTTWENSICSFRGRSSAWSVLRR